MNAALESQHSTNQNADLTPLITLSAGDMKQVDAAILAMAGSEVEMIPEISHYLISSGGKRLRPMLCLTAARMFGYQGTEHIRLATAVEFMHTATLLHDDVVDESTLRRGRSTARTLWGNQASILVGDFLLGQAFKMMVEVGSMEALGVLAQAAATIAEGEVMQLAAAKELETTESDYLKIINAKTAALFSAATEIGPIIAASDLFARQQMRLYGTALGLAFQLVDDVLDYAGKAGDLGKNVGDDFREGKITLPVIFAYARSNDEEKNFWRRSLSNGENDEQAFAHAKSLITQHHGLIDTITRARHYGEQAMKALAPLPASPQKEALEAVVEFCIARLH
ncbi:polyprenyl synthetase family protein [Bartonella sp. DGB2]|uniref:polyprenyl synthetase family protein n=1 Tax=Bartonella sp. DGB2 TaxID=3388426 RepID=UPI00399009E3